MIFENALACRGFTLCYGSFTPNELLDHYNTGDGIANQAVYVYFGTAVVSQNGKNIEMLPNKVTDISEFMGSPYSAVGGDAGASWVAINPVPATKKYNITVAPVGSSVVTSISPECVVLCVAGSIECNSKVLNKMQYVRVPNNTSVNLNISENSVALIMTA